METRNIICIRCPLGCMMNVTIENGEVTKVTGNTCKRGEVYAQKEVTAPTRTVTSTVKVLGAKEPVIAVKTETDIPKECMMNCMKEINKAVVQAPVQIGDIIIENVCGTGVNVVATANSTN